MPVFLVNASKTSSGPYWEERAEYTITSALSPVAARPGAARPSATARIRAPLRLVCRLAMLGLSLAVSWWVVRGVRLP